MLLSILICLAAFIGIVVLARRDGLSLGLPIAYLFSLLLIHVPGAIAHLVGEKILVNTEYTELGIAFTAIGSIAFVGGVALAQWRMRTTRIRGFAVAYAPENLALFCLVVGWIVTYGLSPLRSVPTLGAAVDKAGAIWMLGVILGLQAAVRRGDVTRIAAWLSALAVYPILMLLLGGFLSYGSQAIIIVLSSLAIVVRSHWRALAGAAIAAVLGLHIFLSYFQQRDEIRDAVWGGASIEQRIDKALTMIDQFGLFDPENEKQLTSFDLRLNQNYFVGLAARRIADGEVDYLYGRSLWEGVLALVPRAIWPEKPVMAGSPKVVSEMTGLTLAEGTSFGVGNVMEFQINFGVPGVIGGFVILGFLIGQLDRKAAIALQTTDFSRAFIFFLPAVALIQPNGSIVELVSGSLSALAAGYGWRWAWKHFVRKTAGPADLRGVIMRRGR